jgi:predicted pyridoxine 5'-phosphate oxidase superfamily flavin-nucleotide-binding protein
MPAALQGWHPGEVALQRELGYADGVSEKWANIDNDMREQHHIFHTSNLPFIPITTLDDRGRPWGSVLAGPIGEMGFVKSPDAQTLTVDARVWDGEPLLSTIRTWVCQQDRKVAAPERFLTAVNDYHLF